MHVLARLLAPQHLSAGCCHAELPGALPQQGRPNQHKFMYRLACLGLIKQAQVRSSKLHQEAAHQDGSHAMHIRRASSDLLMSLIWGFIWCSELTYTPKVIIGFCSHSLISSLGLCVTLLLAKSLHKVISNCRQHGQRSPHQDSKGCMQAIQRFYRWTRQVCFVRSGLDACCLMYAEKKTITSAMSQAELVQFMDC